MHSNSKSRCKRNWNWKRLKAQHFNQFKSRSQDRIYIHKYLFQCHRIVDWSRRCVTHCNSTTSNSGEEQTSFTAVLFSLVSSQIYIHLHLHASRIWIYARKTTNNLNNKQKLHISTRSSAETETIGCMRYCFMGYGAFVCFETSMLTYASIILWNFLYLTDGKYKKVLRKWRRNYKKKFSVQFL